MRFGYVSMNSAVGIRPDVLGRELEDRGFESMWVPEHSHIPVARTSPYPSGGELPIGYLHMMDPLVSLTAAAVATTRLVVATGVCLLLEHGLAEFAGAAATLDQLSNGRLLLGVGVGWNREELADHRPELPFAQRYSALIERMDALRTIWGNDEPVIDGTWDKLSPSWVYPKPVHGRIPFAMGNAGPVGMALAARHADQWCPIDTALPLRDGKPDVAGAVEQFRTMVADAGRDPASVPITVFSFSRPTPARMARYAALDLERVVLAFPHAELSEPDDTVRHLDELTPILAEFGG